MLRADTNLLGIGHIDGHLAPSLNIRLTEVGSHKALNEAGVGSTGIVEFIELHE